MAVKDAFRSLAEMNPHVDQIVSYDARWSTRRDQRRSGLGESLRLRRELASLDTAFVFDFHPFSRLLLRSTGIPCLIGYGPGSSCLSLALSGPPPHQHRLEDGLALLAAAGIPTGAPDYGLRIPPHSRRSAEGLLRDQGWEGEPLLAICPGAGNPQKCWPPERFAALANVLGRKRSRRIVLLGSPYDHARAQMVAGSLHSSPIILTREIPMQSLAALLAACELTLTNDSARMHLSAALGCSLVALFGPTDPAKWGPRGSGSQVVLRAPSGDIHDLSVDNVLEAVRASFGEVA
ncbi:MAG: hypothetical protein L0212_00435 [Acidobacteria bacterium]|nr:hypothetical protein [Acidobacteriota bacterium]